MKTKESRIITNGKDTIKCSNCGSEKKFVLIDAAKQTDSAPTIKFESYPTENPMSEQQKYVAHIFEAQRRFGE